jgi:hypothetical protein
VSARTAQDSLRNYSAISDKVSDRSDPFLFTLLRWLGATGDSAGLPHVLRRLLGSIAVLPLALYLPSISSVQTGRLFVFVQDAS